MQQGQAQIDVLQLNGVELLSLLRPWLRGLPPHRRDDRAVVEVDALDREVHAAGRLLLRVGLFLKDPHDRVLLAGMAFQQPHDRPFELQRFERDLGMQQIPEAIAHTESLGLQHDFAFRIAQRDAAQVESGEQRSPDPFDCEPAVELLIDLGQQLADDEPRNGRRA